LAEIKVFENILSRNDKIAEQNKKLIGKAFSINMMSSPGAGKTAILEKTAAALKQHYKIAVIEGDITTSNDARRIKKQGVDAVQIKTENFGGGCHLDAKMVSGALKKIKNKRSLDLLIIENVGNLICPADFNLGEGKKVVALSVTEGDDKPLKYPQMFAQADLMLLNKTDLLPYVDFDTGKMMKYLKRVNKKLQVIKMSAKEGSGMGPWLAWIRAGIRAKRGR
jgi:hydrogenase nickel incorporation protein HypB